MDQTVSLSDLKGTISAPASKSDAQRALLAASFSDGKSVIVNAGTSDDVLGMIAALGRVGVDINFRGDEIQVEGGWFISDEQMEIYVGESGLALRLLICVCASIGGKFRFTGKGTLNTRDHEFFLSQIRKYGVDITSENGHLPIELSGKLKGNRFELDGSGSSQFISGMLLGLPLLQSDITVIVKDLKSYPYVEMTLRTMDMFGVEVIRKENAVFSVKKEQFYESSWYHVEADWSSASYWIVAAAIGHHVQIYGLNMQSHQADRMILDALTAANCSYIFEHDTLTVEGSNRKPFTFDATHCPDLFPALVTLAAFTDGISEIKRLHRLANKESDRGIVLKEEFGKLGLPIELKGDSMFIEGGHGLRGAHVSSHGDHRIAMCLAITGTKIEEGITIEGAEAVGKSYPGFWKDLRSVIQ